MPIAEFDWETLLGIELEPTGATRPNVGALAAFGVLGLAASRPGGTFILLREPRRQVLLESKEPLPQVRALLLQFDAPRELLSGREPQQDSTTSRSEAQASSLADELERLKALHIDGVLTDEEFREAKQRTIHGEN